MVNHLPFLAAVATQVHLCSSAFTDTRPAHWALLSSWYYSQAEAKPGYPAQGSILPQPVPDGFSDHVSKTITRVSLGAEHRSSGTANDDAPCRWVMWMHGGSYCAGAQYAPDSGAGGRVHVIPTSDRFLPHVDFQGQLDDCADAYNGCRANLAEC